MTGVPSPQELALLIEGCWHANPEKRPHFSEVVVTLGGILDRMPQKKEGAANAGGGCCSIS